MLRMFASSLLFALPAWADDVVVGEAEVRRPLVGWPIFELRGGIQGVEDGLNAMACGELSPWKVFAIEACGSGAGFLFPGTPTEIVHFRVEGNVPLLQRGKVDLVLQPGLGFAEVEAGSDRPGFLFGRARTAGQREGAGPEVSLSTKGRWWAHERVYATAEVGVSGAHVPSAPTVLGQEGPIVVSGLATFGLGF